MVLSNQSLHNRLGLGYPNNTKILASTARPYQPLKPLDFQTAAFVGVFSLLKPCMLSKRAVLTSMWSAEKRKRERETEGDREVDDAINEMLASRHGRVGRMGSTVKWGDGRECV